MSVPNAVSQFIGKYVRTEDWDFSIDGYLVFFQESCRDGHKPNVLIVQNEKGKHIVRS